MIKNYLFPFAKKKMHEGPRYGDMYARSLAAGIDLALIFLLLNNLLFTPLTMYIYSFADQQLFSSMPRDVLFSQFIQTAWEAKMIQLWLLNVFLQFLVIGFFMVGFQITYHTTPGKWLFGMKVVRFGSDEPVGGLRYVVRFFGYGVACFPLMLGMVWGMFQKQQRGWHDYIAGTAVVNTRPNGWYWEKVKRGFRWLRARLFPLRAVENTVAEPTTEKRHENGE